MKRMLASVTSQMLEEQKNCLVILPGTSPGLQLPL